MTNVTARAQQAPVEGQRVAEIRVLYATTGGNAEELVPPLALKAGKPFDFEAERESLRELYRMGDYSNIQVTATPEAEGLRVDFVVRRNYYVNVVRIEGLNSPPSEPAALASMRLSLGEPFRDSSLREAVERLTEVFAQEGLYLAKASWTLEPHDDTRQMDITVHVEPGPRARAGSISFKNETPYPESEILSRLKLSGKDEITSNRLLRAAQRLKNFLVGQGYLGAGVVITPGTYDAQTNRAPLTCAVTAGPRVRVEISGANLSKGERRKLLPIYAEGAVDEDLLQEGRRNIRDYFQRQGYFNADVEVSSEEDTARGERVIRYDITRGDRFRLDGIGFDGNKYFNQKMLARRLQLQPASFASSGRYSQQLARDDADSIRGLYLSNGFREAQVSTTVDDNYRGKKDHLFVTFHIVEGEQTRIASLELEGNQRISTATLLGVIGSTSGQPYSEADIASDRNNVLALYFNEGFTDAHFQEEIQPTDAPDRLRLIYHITEGTQIEVRNVLLTGYEYTRPGVIAREVEVHAGQPLRESDVLATQRQLYNLGIFDRVQIEPQNPDGADPKKTVVVDAEEGDRYTLGYGFGFEVQRLAGNSTNPTGTTLNESPRGIFEISRGDMFGRAQTLSFKARASTLEYRGALGYTADDFLALRSLSFQLTGFAEKTQDINTFTSTKAEGARNWWKSSRRRARCSTAISTGACKRRT